MNLFRNVSSSLAVLLLAATAAAQQPTPIITSIPPRVAFDPVRVAILGTNLGIVTEVRVNGVVTPIVRVTATRLVVGPVPPQIPGFGTVELVYGRGTVVGTIEFTPTLSASRRGTRVMSRLNNGEPGAFVLRFSYERLPALEVDDGIYYGRLIPADSAVLAAGVFADELPVEVVARLPIEVGLIGAPLNLQSLNTFAASGVQSYSNLAVVSGFGQHQ